MQAEALSHINKERLKAVCEQYGIARLSIFGSMARDESTPSSDVDLLYELRPGMRLGWEIEDLADTLAEIFGRPVDLVARRSVHPLLKDAVLDTARPFYAA
jgi:predicted nucleotidyltransferase